MLNIDNKKITDSHSTLTETAEEVIRLVVKYNEVSKIGIGFITHVHGGRRDLKFLPIVGGIKAIVRGSGAVQELYIYTEDVDLTRDKLVNSFR